MYWLDKLGIKVLGHTNSNRVSDKYLSQKDWSNNRKDKMMQYHKNLPNISKDRKLGQMWEGICVFKL